MSALPRRPPDALGQFAEVWALDTEFRRPPGGLPEPVCCVCARELKSGREIRLWAEHGAPQPFDTGPHNLFVAQYSSAEWLSFLAMGWRPPTNIIDTYVEGRVLTNGLPGRKESADKREGRRRRCGLLDLAARYGIASIADAQKDAGRALAMRGPSWSEDERVALLDYCMSDVRTTGEVFLAMLPEIVAPQHGLAQAMIRGPYMLACARMELTGIPVDVELFERFKANWPGMRRELIEHVDSGRYDCFVDGVFKKERFAELLDRLEIGRWPRTPTGQLELCGSTFRDMCRNYPELEPLRELHSTLQQMKKFTLGIGPDGRHRAEMLSAFGTDTARHNPSKFIFALARWFRGLIKPDPGMAVVYSDFSSQEIWIAAALSRDPNLLEAVHSGDPYLWFAKRVGLAPQDATKATHGQLRDWLKPFLLGIHYGLTATGAAVRLDTGLDEADALLAKHKRLFPVYRTWSESVVDAAVEMRRLTSRWGWRLHVRPEGNLRSLRNHPIQTVGSHILQFAGIGLTESGITLCCPVHDAVLTECRIGEVEERVVEVQQIMRRAAEVASGVAIPVDSEVVRHPNRYMDKRPGSREMFDKAVAALQTIENREVGLDRGGGGR
jgi:DNA polymerase-1